MLSAYGLRLNTDLVRDAQCANVSLVQQQAGFSMQSQVPFPLPAAGEQLRKGNVMVKDLQGVVLFFASSVDTLNGLRARAARGDPPALVQTKRPAWRDRFLYDPLQQYAREDLAAISPRTGSRWRQSSRAVSGASRRESRCPRTPPRERPRPPPRRSTSSPETRVVLVGDGDFARDRIHRRQQGQHDLLRQYDRLPCGRRGADHDPDEGSRQAAP